MKTHPDKIVLDKDYIKKRIQNGLRIFSLLVAFGVIYFFFIKLLFL